MTQWQAMMLKLWWVANIVKGEGGIEAKVLFQGWHVRCRIMCWVIILNFVFFISNLSLGAKHRLFLLHFDLVWCRLCIHVLYHIKVKNFVKVTFLESIIFKAKSMFEPNVFKFVEKIDFINFNFFLQASNHQC